LRRNDLNLTAQFEKRRHYLVMPALGGFLFAPLLPENRLSIFLDGYKEIVLPFDQLLQFLVPLGT
jgi:hypothetical protein